MASFTDQTPQFNPYIQQLPPSLLANVGMYKMQQYQQGLEQAQSRVSNVEGLPIAKDIVKDYVRGKLNQVKSSLMSLSGDFSDSRVVGQVGGLTTKITGDPIIQNAVKGTTDAQQSMSQMEEDHKNGKLTPQNQYDFEDEYSKWLNDGQLTSSFNGGYSTHVDYMKQFLDAYNVKHPSSSITQDDVRINDGTGVLEVTNERTHEGISADEVKSIWDQVASDPSVQNQLRIDGKYRFRGYDPGSLNNEAHNYYNQHIEGINQQIKDIQTKAGIYKDVTPEVAAKQIEGLRTAGVSIENEYKDVAQLIKSNPEAAKTTLFSTYLSSGLSRNYSWNKDSDKLVNSPLFQAHMDQLNYELSVQRLSEEKDYHKDELDIRRQELAMKLLKAGKKAPGEVGSGELPDGTATQTSEDKVDEHAGEKTPATYTAQTAKLEAATNQKIRETIFNMANKPGQVNPYRWNGTTYEYNVDPTGNSGYKTQEDARQAGADIYTIARTAVMNGKANDFTVSRFQELDPMLRKVNNRRMMAQNIEETHQELSNAIKQQFKDDVEKLGGTTIKVAPANQLTWEKTDFSKDFKEGAPGTMTISAAEMARAIKGQSDKLKVNEKETDQPLQFTLLKDGKEIPVNFNYNHWALEALYKKVKTLGGSSKYLQAQSEADNQREESYKQAQTVYKPNSTVILANKAEDKENYRQLFQNIASTRNVNGNANSFLDWLDKGNTQKQTGEKDDTMKVVYDKNTEKWYLRISRGSKDRDLEVSEKDVQQLGIQTQNPFWNKYGDDLSLTNNRTTDVHNRGIASAYSMSRPVNSKLQVKYHVVGNGQGMYDLYTYIQDENGKLIGEGNMGLWTDMNGIMKATDGSTPDVIYKGLVNTQK